MRVMWTPTMAVRHAINFRPDELEVSINVEYIKRVNVVVDGVLRKEWALIRFRGVEYNVRASTLDLPEILV